MVMSVCIVYPDVFEMYQISSRDKAKHFYMSLFSYVGHSRGIAVQISVNYSFSANANARRTIILIFL